MRLQGHFSAAGYAKVKSSSGDWCLFHPATPRQNQHAPQEPLQRVRARLLYITISFSTTRSRNGAATRGASRLKGYVPLNFTGELGGSGGYLRSSHIYRDSKRDADARKEGGPLCCGPLNGPTVKLPRKGLPCLDGDHRTTRGSRRVHREVNFDAVNLGAPRDL